MRITAMYTYSTGFKNKQASRKLNEQTFPI